MSLSTWTVQNVCVCAMDFVSAGTNTLYYIIILKFMKNTPFHIVS